MGPRSGRLAAIVALALATGCGATQRSLFEAPLLVEPAGDAAPDAEPDAGGEGALRGEGARVRIADSHLDVGALTITGGAIEIDGGQLRVGPRKQLGLTLELKWLRPYLDTEPFILGYLGPGNQGALSFMSGITVYIPGKRERERQREREEAAEQAAPTTSNTEEVLR